MNDLNMGEEYTEMIDITESVRPIAPMSREYYNTDEYDEFYNSDKYKSNIRQFTTEGDSFFPCVNTVKDLPNGYYRIMKDYTRGVYFKKMQVNLNKLVLLESSTFYSVILKDIVTFWESKKKYELRGKIHRRNLLLHSEPGMGKTSLINLIVNDLTTNRNGFVISLSSVNDIMNFSEAMSIIRTVMPQRPVIAIIEDIDNFISNNGRSEVETELLNILDGIRTFSNIVILATTNYPETLTERYINRPSRFNRVMEIPLPDENIRREFLIKTNIKEDIESINLEEWVKRTEGFTIDFLKELSDSVFIAGNSEEETFKMLAEMRERKVVRNISSKLNGIGFTNGK